MKKKILNDVIHLNNIEWWSMLLNTHYEHIFVLNTYAYIYVYPKKSGKL